MGQLRSYEQDAQGRLQKVHESSGASGERVRTHYNYDAAGRLQQVSTSTSGGSNQVRKFAYDGRGFLKEECHPEKGYLSSGTIGCVGYGGYDALGNAGHTEHEDSFYNLTFSFDSIGRPTQVARTEGGLLKEFFYGRSNDGANLLAGKLYQAKRHNVLNDPTSQGSPPTLNDYVVTETYRYGMCQ